MADDWDDGTRVDNKAATGADSHLSALAGEERRRVGRLPTTGGGDMRRWWEGLRREDRILLPRGSHRAAGRSLAGMRRTLVGVIGPVVALVLLVSSIAVASPSVQVSEQFVKVAKRALKELAERTFESRACRGNLTCEAFVETLIDAAESVSTSDATAIFDKLADSVLRIGLDYLVDRHLLPLQEDLAPQLPRACADTVGKARRELAGCLAARLLKTGRVPQCRLKQFFKLAEELNGSDKPALAQFSSGALDLKKRLKDYNTPVEQSDLATGAAKVWLTLQWDATSKGLDTISRLAWLKVVADALEMTLKSQPTDFFGTAWVMLDNVEQALVRERQTNKDDLSDTNICTLGLFRPKTIMDAFNCGRPGGNGDHCETVKTWLAEVGKCCPNPGGVATSDCPVRLPEDNQAYKGFLKALSGLAQLPVGQNQGSLVKPAGEYYWSLALARRDGDDLRRLRPWLLTTMALVDYLRQEDGGTLLARRMLDIALREVVDETGLDSSEADAICRLAKIIQSEPGDPADSLKQLLAGLSHDSAAALKRLVRESVGTELCSCPQPGTAGAGSPGSTSPCDLESCFPSTADQLQGMATGALVYAARRRGSDEIADMLLAASGQGADAVRKVRELAVGLVAGEVSDAMSEAIKSAVHTDNEAGEVVQELVTHVFDTMLDVVVGGRGESAASTSQHDLLKALEKLSSGMDGFRIHLTLGPSIAWTSSPWLSSEQATDSQRNQIHLTVLDLYGGAYQWRSGLYVGLAVGGFLDDLERTLGLKGSEETYPLWRLALVGGYRFGNEVPLSLEVTAGGAFPADTKEEYWNRGALAASFNVTLPVDMVLDANE